MATTAFEILELGLHLIFITPEEAAGAGLSTGAVVWRVEPGPSQAAGLRAGDVVAAINGQTIASRDDLRRAVSAIGPGKSGTDPARQRNVDGGNRLSSVLAPEP